MNNSPLILRRLLFGNPERIYPTVSPNGRRLAYLAPLDGVLNVWMKDLASGRQAPVTDDRGRGVRSYFWAQRSDFILYVQDRDGDENWNVFVAPTDGGPPRNLTPFDGAQVRIIKTARAHPHLILVAANHRRRDLHDVFSVDITTGERRLEVINDIGAHEWFADNELHIALAQVPLPDGGFRLMQRMPGGDWRELRRWGSEDVFGTAPIGFAADNRILYLNSSIGTNTSGLRALDTHTGAERVIASDPSFDVGSPFIHPVTYEVQAVSFIRDRREWLVLDPQVAGDFEFLRSFKDADFSIVNRDDADRVWLVAYICDNSPVEYYQYVRSDRQLVRLFSTHPQLESLPLARMKPVVFSARDGLKIHGYLTLPPDAEGAKGLPTVISIHGGPWSRVMWGFDPESQWLANRGYAVLQINFRGSTGFGKNFTNAGDRQWGGAMQDDITDGAKWLIDSGIADPRRIALFGGSYGGYAVLSGLTQMPAMYRCGVDMFGPSNLLTFLNAIPPYWEPVRPAIYRRIGHPEHDRDFLMEHSPLNFVDNIQAPLFIVQGRNDPRVKRDESIQLRDALIAAGKQVVYMEFEDEGHGFVRPANRLKFYAAAERFLAEHLGGRYEE